ncbi:MAG: hypothetical protein WC782_15250 [Methylococcaceae bacterium]|jgi:hypothetical protein
MPLSEQLKQMLSTCYGQLKAIHYHWYILGGLMLLSILGVAIVDATEVVSHWYWLALVPVFFSACLYVEWDATKESGVSARTIVFKQVLHWSGLLIAVFLAFFLRNIGSLDNQTTGLVLLLLLALTTFLAGVTMGWLFRLLGIFLGLSLYFVAYMEHYLQMILWAALGIFVLFHFLIRYFKHS